MAAGSANTNIEWTSSDAAVLRTLNKVEGNMDRLSRKMNSFERDSRRASGAMAGGFDRIHGSIMGIAGGLLSGGAILSGMQAWSEKMTSLRAEADQLAGRMDTINRKMAVQSGLPVSVTTNALEPELKRILVKNAFEDVEVAGGMINDLTGAGYAPRDAVNLLDLTLERAAAGNVEGIEVKPEELSAAVLQYMTSQGMQPNVKDFNRVIDKFINAMSVSNAGTGHFGQLASRGAALAGKLSEDDQLAGFVIGSDAMGAEQASTGLRNFVTILNTARANKKVLSNFEKMGIDPSQVDFIGEGLEEVLGVLDAGLKSLPIEERNVALSQIFGREVESFANTQSPNGALVFLVFPGMVMVGYSLITIFMALRKLDGKSKQNESTETNG